MLKAALTANFCEYTSIKFQRAPEKFISNLNKF